jgi:hypothetical protein
MCELAEACENRTPTTKNRGLQKCCSERALWTLSYFEDSLVWQRCGKRVAGRLAARWKASRERLEAESATAKKK